MMRQVLVLIGILLCASAASATPITVVTDADWKSWDSAPAGWTGLAFDDSSWRNAYEGYTAHPDPTTYPAVALAGTIWDWPYAGTPSGLNGPLQAYFRRSVMLDGAALSASFSYLVDDELTLYVNGVEAYVDRSGGANYAADIALDPSLFTSGENLIAIYAFDGGGFGVYNRGGESLTASLAIETSGVPEPSTLLLLGLGFAGLVGVRRTLAR